MRNVALLLIALIVLSLRADAQSPTPRRPAGQDQQRSLDSQPQNSKQREVRKLFSLIEHAIATASMNSATSHFGQQVFVNMTGGESGYFSANQTVSILQRYMSARSSLSFEFSRYSDTGSTPYATGRLGYVLRGRRESAQVYVSLRSQDSKWVISQFNIY